MNRPTTLLLRCLGIRRPQPKTRFGVHLRRLERVLFYVGVFYTGLHVFPQVLFAHSVSAEGITIHSRSALPPEAAACAARAASLLRQSELFEPGREEHVFVCNSPWLFRLFHPTSTAFAFSVPVTDHVFVAAADVAGDVATRPAAEFNRRTLSGLMAHEITHGLIRHRLGLLRGVRLVTWVAEGYCDYVAGEGSFPEEEGRRLFASGQNDPSMSYRYFTYRQMVGHLLEDERLSFDQLVARAAKSVAVEAEARAALRSTETH